jgi:hypothetical protein
MASKRDEIAALLQRAQQDLRQRQAAAKRWAAAPKYDRLVFVDQWAAQALVSAQDHRVLREHLAKDDAGSCDIGNLYLDLDKLVRCREAGIVSADEYETKRAECVQKSLQGEASKHRVITNCASYHPKPFVRRRRIQG